MLNFENIMKYGGLTERYNMMFRCHGFDFPGTIPEVVRSLRVFSSFFEERRQPIDFFVSYVE